MLLRRLPFALLLVGVTLCAAAIATAQAPTCTRTGSKVTIGAADTAVTCALHAGAVTYTVTVTPAKPKITPAPTPVPTPTPVDTAKPVPTPVPVDTAKPTPPSSSYAAADVMSNESFESGWGKFTNWSGGGTPSGVTRDNSTAADGAWSVKRTWVPSSADVGAQLMSATGASDHVWVRFSFKLTAPITTVMKFVRFYDPQNNVNLGGFFIGRGSDIVTFGTDQENSAITTSIGLTESQVIDGRWHTLEIDYWRNGDPSGYPSAAFYFDGVALSGAPIHYAGAGNSSYWKDGRLYAGKRGSSVRIGYIQWLSTLNGGNTTTGQVNLDRVAISTKGRIGP